MWKDRVRSREDDTPLQILITALGFEYILVIEDREVQDRDSRYMPERNMCFKSWVQIPFVVMLSEEMQTGKQVRQTDGPCTSEEY
jgi:hypothetical protein